MGFLRAGSVVNERGYPGSCQPPQPRPQAMLTFHNKTIARILFILPLPLHWNFSPALFPQNLTVFELNQEKISLSSLYLTFYECLYVGLSKADLQGEVPALSPVIVLGQPNRVFKLLSVQLFEKLCTAKFVFKNSYLLCKLSTYGPKYQYWSHLFHLSH